LPSLIIAFTRFLIPFTTHVIQETEYITVACTVRTIPVRSDGLGHQ
jgi:hypothetical protein